MFIFHPHNLFMCVNMILLVYWNTFRVVFSSNILVLVNNVVCSCVGILMQELGIPRYCVVNFLVRQMFCLNVQTVI
jgi:hypothetical protein